MSHRAVVYGVTVLSALGGVLGLPARARADSGGSGLGPVPAGASPSADQGSPTGNGNAVVTASGAGMTISSRVSALLRGQLHVTGQVGTGQAGEIVEIDRLGRETGGRWAPTTHTRIGADGSFTAVWHVNHIGRFRLRAVILSGATSHAASTSPTLTITVYRPSMATIYGPGLYGNRTACGETLGRHMLGVANRTLPCGTPVALYYQGRTIVVPVIDRGPYANGADWDLTMATAKRLGLGTTATIGAVSLPAGSPSSGAG